MIDLSGKVTVVTGGAQGIGRAIAELLAQQGSNVVVADIQMEKAEATAKEIAANTSQQAIAVQVDVADSDSAKAMIDSAIAKFGRVDILINNAGITRDNLIMRMGEDEWDLVLSINLKGAFNCSRAVIRPMMKQRYGRIINITSVGGLAGNPGQANYAASKGGIMAFTKTVALEVAKRGITVNAVAPGFIKTEMTEALPEKIKEQLKSQIPSGQLGEVGDVAELVFWLCSDAARYITGQVIHVNGGMFM